MKSLLTKTMVSTDDKMANGLSFSFDPPCGEEAWELEWGLGIRNNIKKKVINIKSYFQIVSSEIY